MNTVYGMTINDLICMVNTKIKDFIYNPDTEELTLTCFKPEEHLYCVDTKGVNEYVISPEIPDRMFCFTGFGMIKIPCDILGSTILGFRYGADTRQLTLSIQYCEYTPVREIIFGQCRWFGEKEQCKTAN